MIVRIIMMPTSKASKIMRFKTFVLSEFAVTKIDGTPTPIVGEAITEKVHAKLISAL